MKTLFLVQVTKSLLTDDNNEGKLFLPKNICLFLHTSFVLKKGMLHAEKVYGIGFV